YYATNPEWFAIGVLALAVLIGFGAKLDGQIMDSMRFLWKQRATTPSIQHSALHTAVRNFRLSAGYQSTIRALKYYIFPFLSAVAVVYVCTVALNHLAFNLIDPTGVLCQGTKVKLDELDEGKMSTKSLTFSTSDLCFATGIRVTRGFRYAIEVTPKTPWSFGDLFPTTPKGFRGIDAPMRDVPLMYLAMPFRRDYFRRWYSLVARVGARGMYEDFADQSLEPGKANTYGGETGVLKHDGELFLYVNDATIAFPGLFGTFYDHNQGTAEIRVQRIITKPAS
ncbi:MAG: hypothetical protein WAK55_09600, partial [Xanthobacteraceae bacterium]